MFRGTGARACRASPCLVRAVPGVDQDRIGPAQDQKAERRHAPSAAAIAPKHEEARLELDVAIIENLDFQRHVVPSTLPWSGSLEHDAIEHDAIGSNRPRACGAIGLRITPRLRIFETDFGRAGAPAISACAWSGQRSW